MGDMEKLYLDSLDRVAERLAEINADIHELELKRNAVQRVMNNIEKRLKSYRTIINQEEN